MKKSSTVLVLMVASYSPNGTTWFWCIWCHIAFILGGNRMNVRLNLRTFCYIFTAWKWIVLAFWCVTHEQDTCCELFNLHNNLINFPRAKTKSKLYERNNSIISAHFCGLFNESPALFLCFSLSLSLFY